MRIRILAGYLAIMVGFIACSDETTVFEDTLQDDVVLETNESALKASISFSNSGVLDIFEDTASNLPAGKLAEPAAGEYPLTLVAQVKPPSYNGNTSLTASHVDVNGDYAYVAYNVPGEEYFGAIEIINVANPNNPLVTSRLFYLNADINSISYDNGYVFVAGGVNAETSVSATTNSFIARIPVINNRLNTGAGISYGFQPGFNANDLLVDGNRVIVTSGKDGSITVYDKNDLSVQQEAIFADLRSVAIHNGNLAILDAGTGVRILDNNLLSVKDISITTDLGLATKKTLDFRGDRIMVSEGSKGTGVYSFATGSLIEYIPILISPDGVAEEDIVTNAVATNESELLMANGGAGLCLSEEGPDGYEVFGIVELEGSINYVASRNDYIFAASGNEGLQIIKFNRPNQGLESRCRDLLDYEGSAKLFVNSGEVAEFKGAKRFNSIDNRGSLLLCGSWTVKNDISVDDVALFEMKGTLVVGRNNRKKEIKVGKNATLRIEGNLTIYGDLILEDGATLEFLGPASVVNITGKLDINNDVTITGDFTDVQNIFP